MKPKQVTTTTNPAPAVVYALQSRMTPICLRSSLGNDNVSVLLNRGDGAFADDALYGAGDGPGSVAIGDLDGDGDLDLAVANSGSNNVSVLLNGCVP